MKYSLTSALEQTPTNDGPGEQTPHKLKLLLISKGVRWWLFFFFQNFLTMFNFYSPFFQVMVMNLMQTKIKIKLVKKI